MSCCVSFSQKPHVIPWGDSVILDMYLIKIAAILLSILTVTFQPERGSFFTDFLPSLNL